MLVKIFVCEIAAQIALSDNVAVEVIMKDGRNPTGCFSIPKDLFFISIKTSICQRAMVKKRSLNHFFIVSFLYSG